MSTLNSHHKELTDGVGKCSVPMWSGGVPAGFCDAVAYGPQLPGQQRYGNWDHSYGSMRWVDGYCSGLACYAHGGPSGRVTLPTNGGTADV